MAGILRQVVQWVDQVAQRMDQVVANQEQHAQELREFRQRQAETDQRCLRHAPSRKPDRASPQGLVLVQRSSLIKPAVAEKKGFAPHGLEYGEMTPQIGAV
jgi:hypothetical protein